MSGFNWREAREKRELYLKEAAQNLNERPIETDGSYRQYRYDNSADTEEISVYFRSLEEKLIEEIKKHDMVVGCVAWLTNENILEAMSTVKCAIVVQKEDFLRPDTNHPFGWKERLRWMYSRLKMPYDRFELGSLLGSMSTFGDPSIGGVRCVGNHNKEKLPSFPRMHNKFIVLCNVVEPESRYEDVSDDEGFSDCERIYASIRPQCVWTGSFNFTQNATLSLENAVIIRNPTIVNAYYDEWEHIEALSEPLDWESEWCAPEWRVGT